jgi:hypothetical protein
MDRPLNSNELIKAVMVKVAAGALLDCSKELGKVLDKESCQELAQMGGKALELFEACITATGDECQAEAARRRADALKVGVSYDKKRLQTMICLTPEECTTLVGHALNYCDMECPYAELSGDGCTVDKAAVKGCELQKLYRRIGLAHSGVVDTGCPYYMYCV